MRRVTKVCRRGVCISLFIAAPWCAGASLDFAVSVDLAKLSSPKFAVDRQGNILIAGLTRSCTLPKVRPVVNCGLVWVAKLDPTGQKLLFATYLGSGGVGFDASLAGIAADAAGNILIAADTTDAGWYTRNAIQPVKKGVTNFYLAKLAADGSGAIYATYLGGSGGLVVRAAFGDTVKSLAVDDAGAAYVLGNTYSKDFPTAPQTLGEPAGPVVVKLSPDGQSLVYTAFPPASSNLSESSISLDASGGVVLWLHTFDAAVSEVWRLAPDGSAIVRAASFNSMAQLNGSAAFASSAGGYVLTGSVVNGNLPVTSGAAQAMSGASPYGRVEDGQVVRVPVPAHRANTLTADPQNRNRIFAATDAGLFLSPDNGWTWNQVWDMPCSFIAVDPFDSNRLYASAGNARQFFRSTDGGRSWQAVGNTNILSISVDPNVPGLLYANTGSAMRSTDGGDTWTTSWSQSTTGGMPSFSFSFATSVYADPAHPGWAYLLSANGCNMGCPVYRPILQTKDAGVTWNAVGTLNPALTGLPAGVLEIGPGDVDPATGDLYIPYYGQLWVFHWANPGLQLFTNVPPLNAVLFDPENPGRIYAQTANNSLMRSDDEGVTWSSPLAQLDGGLLSAIGDGGVLHLTEPGDAQDAYIFVLDANGTIDYGSYFGGGSTQAYAAGRAGGRVFIAGSTGSGLPTLNPYQPNIGGAKDGFLAAFDESGALLWSTYLGGSGQDVITSVLPLPDGSAIVVGNTDSKDFPSLRPSALGAGTVFIARLGP